MKSMVSDNLMIVGDAAHQVNPIHGGGISESFVAGRLAGEVAAEAREAGDYSESFLSRYSKRWWEKRGDRLGSILKLRMVMESLSDEDIDYLAANLRGEDLLDFSKARGFSMLAKLLMKRPRLITIARKLL